MVEDLLVLMQLGIECRIDGRRSLSSISRSLSHDPARFPVPRALGRLLSRPADPDDRQRNESGHPLVWLTIIRVSCWPTRGFFGWWILRSRSRRATDCVVSSSLARPHRRDVSSPAPNASGSPLGGFPCPPPTHTGLGIVDPLVAFASSCACLGLRGATTVFRLLVCYNPADPQFGHGQLHDRVLELDREGPSALAGCRGGGDRENGRLPLHPDGRLRGVDAEPVDACRRKVAESDVFVGLVGHLNGSCPDGSDLSFTQIEYEEAKRKRKPRLMFVADDDFSVPARLFGPESEEAYSTPDRFPGEVSKRADGCPLPGAAGSSRQASSPRSRSTRRRKQRRVVRDGQSQEAVRGQACDLAKTESLYLAHLAERYRYLDFRGMGISDRYPCGCLSSTCTCR